MIIGQKNVTSRVKKTPPGGHVFLPIRTIFELNRRIEETNVLTKFHIDWAKMCLINCSHVFTIIEKTAPPPFSHVFQMLTTIFKLIQYIHIANINIRKKTPTSGHETNVLTKFHEDWTKNVTSRKIAPPSGGHFHDDWAKIVTSRVLTRFLYSNIGNTAPPPGGHVFQRTRTIFELNQHIIKTNILTNLHEDRASNLTSTVFTSFELSRGINGTNVLSKFYEDQTRNVASRVFTRQMLTTDGQCTTDKRR
ncbi:hypothetical protein DPMN_048132 [Dreissena polymorpha]|uniref:Uncharacterized protein n=1 Tax=Dreissena polymorpha TaxID=45954 RepID=A0A9D4DA31_DREPO|nr:hypothetical protein DPMN_048132 [Dreissena polymorpha]